VHKLLTNERILGMDLLRGRKGSAVEPAPIGEVSTDGADRPTTPDTTPDVERPTPHHVPASVAALPHPADDPDESGAGTGTERSETRGLPLFGEKDDDTSEES
jgi:hypothetical protein